MNVFVGKVKLNGAPATPVTDTSVPETGATLAANVIPSVVLADKPPGSVAIIVTVLGAVAEVVPVMAPVVGFMLKPAGKPVAE